MLNPAEIMCGTGGFRRTLTGFVALLILQTATAFGASGMPCFYAPLAAVQIVMRACGEGKRVGASPSFRFIPYPYS